MNMNYLLYLAILGIIATASALVLTRLLIYIMPKFGIVDVPSTRRIHKGATPRGGGLSFVIVLTILLPLAEFFFSGTVFGSVELLKIFLPLCLVSFWDDISHALIPIRLFIQILCSCLAIMWLIHPSTILHDEIPIFLDLVIGAFALLSFLNVYNFLDGIDGITVSESIHLSCTILLLCMLRYDIIPNVDMVIAIATIILGWSAGFIYFNWQPAKIFLGDVGSISLGFLLGICLLTIASADANLFVACFISALYHIADGSITILIRMIKGEKIWEPHLQHFFQKSVSNGRSHKRVVKRIMKCNILLMLFAANALYYPIISVIGGLLVVGITLIRSVA